MFRDLRLSDVSEQANAQNWCCAEFLQLSPGQFTGHFQEYRTDYASVVLEQQSQVVQKRGVMNEEFCTVSYVLDPKAPYRFSEYNAIQENRLFFLPGGTEFDVQVEGGMETLFFRFKQADFLERASYFIPDSFDSDKLDSLFIFNILSLQAVDHFAKTVLSGIPFQYMDIESHNQQIMDQVLTFLADATSIDKCTNNKTISFKRSLNLIDDAIEYMHAAYQNGKRPSIVDLCLALNVSQRTLQYSFQRIFCLTPVHYFRILRLNWVRQSLMHPLTGATRVTNIAMQFGFWHLSKFSSDYASMFGESPSVTLKRSLSRHSLYSK